MLVTFCDLDNQGEASAAIWSKHCYAFPYVTGGGTANDFCLDVAEAVQKYRYFSRFRYNYEDIRHGMMQHFGCLDAYLE